MKDYDICVVGGGLAGCSVALLAVQQGLNVCMIDKIKRTNSLEYETVSEVFLNQVSELVNDATENILKYFAVPNDAIVSAWGTTSVKAITKVNQFHIRKQDLVSVLRRAVEARKIPTYTELNFFQYCESTRKWEIYIHGTPIVCKLLIDTSGRNFVIAKKWESERCSLTIILLLLQLLLRW